MWSSLRGCGVHEVFGAMWFASVLIGVFVSVFLSLPFNDFIIFVWTLVLKR